MQVDHDFLQGYIGQFLPFLGSEENSEITGLVELQIMAADEYPGSTERLQDLILHKHCDILVGKTNDYSASQLCGMLQTFLPNLAPDAYLKIALSIYEQRAHCYPIRSKSDLANVVEFVTQVEQRN